jgi:hypothetical protein
VIHEAATVVFVIGVVEPLSLIIELFVGCVICYWGSGTG